MTTPERDPVRVECEPFPFADTIGGGGIRCSCGWFERTGPKRTMRAVWVLYRRHWAEMHPARRSVPLVDNGTQEHLFDPEPYITADTRKRRSPMTPQRSDGRIDA